jgi:HAD superfamily hydrolase (TIGR01509 family)
MTNGPSKSWRAGRFGSNCAVAIPPSVQSLRALVFDLDALTDIECDGHRVAYNAAFAAHDLDFEWSVIRYRHLLALTDERQRVAAELRKRCVGTESDVLTALLADEIYTTKTMMFDELILDHHLTPRPGLLELMTQAFAAGVPVGVVTSGHRSWAEPLVRQLAGDGVVDTLVTGEDVKKHMPAPEAHRLALWELGISAEDALAVSGSAAGLRAANSAGLATVVITGEGTPHIPAAVAVRPDFGGSDPFGLTDCQRLHGDWWKTHKPSAA